MKKCIIIVLAFSVIIFSQDNDSSKGLVLKADSILDNNSVSTEFLRFQPQPDYLQRLCVLETEEGITDTLFFEDRKHLDELNKEEMKIIIRQFIKLLMER